MAGLTSTSPLPTRIVLHQQSRRLEIEFDDGRVFSLPFEYLRVYSPSAEVKGHGAGQEVLQTGKRNVVVERIEQIGHYAIQPIFSDGHATGLYSWDYLYQLGAEQEARWQDYLNQLAAAGASRDVDTSTPPAAGCGHHH
ncbi:MAG: DUF971 domain-containing protein [Burkholderiaceae bacterium]|nr:MAG: DUF971 domain-containing protein [Burkholderiaceae bacterium]